VFSSTRDAYGKVSEDDLPAKEDLFIWDAADPLGINKHAAEFYHFWYGRAFGIDVTSLRITNTYGPRQDITNPEQGFIGWFIHKAMRGEEIELWGGGQSLRVFIHSWSIIFWGLSRTNTCRSVNTKQKGKLFANKARIRMDKSKYPRR